MAVGPVRSLLATHFQMAWNRSAKEMGRHGRTFMVISLAVLALVIAGPVFLGLLVAGSSLGASLADPGEGPFQLQLLGALLGALSLAGGVVGGLLGGSRQLAWEQYRGFPLAPAQLYLAELVAGLGDLLSLGIAAGLTCVMAGLGWARPALLPLLPWLLVLTVGLFLAVQLLVGSLAARLVKRLHLLLFGLLGLTWIGAMLTTCFVPQSGATATGSQLLALAEGGRLGLKLLAALPTTFAVGGLAAGLKGQWGRALALQVYPLLLLLGCMALGAWLLHRERQATQTQATGAAKALWSFSSPALGLARLQWRTLLSSHLGKFGFAMPLLTIVMIKGPMAHLVAPSGWALPSAFLYLALLGNQFHFNQFGLDRHGVTALFLLPISARDLLRGKLLGLAAYQGAQVLMLTLLMGVLLRPGPLELLGSLLLMLCLFLLTANLGQLFSALYPRAVEPNNLRGGQLPMPSLLASLGCSLCGSLCFGGPYYLLMTFAPSWLVPGMALLASLAFLFHRLAQPVLAEIWQDQQENIIQAMG